ncbi:hypothetical protein FNT36_00430 [Hymenobacter setariae]|uniref:SRPBCC family protein n=1 Tax=Hymenobacter setariae TaxID=2594794 RepID=A0A558C1E6_9BACT|nr:SRPBCC family protein [Hymenobacter setariae]TVT42599.1 hypothetical protein FNT36_00430 [Hymenobacter setariae]
MKSLFAIALAAVYGLVIRLLFGFANGLMEIMSITFLFLVPMGVGYLTVLLLPAVSVRTRVGAFFMPWLTSLVLLIITLALNVEGTICWLMVFPIFATFAGIGGIIAFSQRSRGNKGSDNSQQPTSLNVSFLVAGPLVLGFIEGEKALIPKQLTISREVVVEAPPTVVWQQLTSRKTSAPPASTHSLAALFGFPRHLTTTLDTFKVGGKRVAHYEKGLYFEETVASYQPARQLVLQVNANPSAVPPAVMDEHIMIGGKHLDILQDTYQLQPLAGGRTRLHLASQFYINTPFNWYAEIWAHYLMADILDGELAGLKVRASAN